MRITTGPFERIHIAGAAELLAARQARDRSRDARLPAAFEQAEACRGLVEEAVEADGAVAFAAVAGDELVGYMAATPMLVAPTELAASFFAPRAVNVWYPAHAARDGMEYDVYRALYAAIAEDFVGRGFYDHNIFTSATDAAVLEACVSLGFGQQVTAAIKTLDDEAQPPQIDGVEIHEASAEDLRVVDELYEELLLHHARSPIFLPHVRETAAGHEELQVQLLSDPVANPHFVAYRGATPLGMNTYMAPDWLTEMIRPEGTWYLYQGIVSEAARAGGLGRMILRHGLAWARERRYGYVALHFASANISGGRFWVGNGFTPVEYRMNRHIDERIAWANR